MTANDTKDLAAQLRFSRAIHEMARVITRDFDATTIGEAMVAIIGETLDVDRTLIYDIRFDDEVAEGLCEWLNPLAEGIEPTKATYPIETFIGGAEHVRKERTLMVSHADEIHPALMSDGSGELLHGPMNIKSLLWYPFDYEPRRFFVLVFNQVRHRRHWSDADLAFVSEVAELVSMAHLRIRLEERRRDTVERSQRARRLEALGLLAGGVAHDFNNLLTAILGNASLLARKLESDPRRPLADNITGAAEAAAAMCKQLLTYSGRGDAALTLIDVNALIQDTVSIATVQGQPPVVAQLADEPLWIKGDRAQVQQVLINLLANAVDALGDDTTAIEVRTGVGDPATVSNGIQFVGTVPHGAAPFIEVQDHGSGMDAETRARIFEPFYSTKPTGHGLGLATVHGVLGRHQAAIGVTSALGTGTTVTVFFPAVLQAADAAVEEQRTARRVLVVDDEPMVRSVCESALALDGYQVLTAASGREALSHLEEERVDVIVLDIGMPDLDGRETYHALRERGCNAPVVFISGHELGEGLGPPDPASWVLLAKPFRPGELLSAVHSMHAR